MLGYGCRDRQIWNCNLRAFTSSENDQATVHHCRKTTLTFSPRLPKVDTCANWTLKEASAVTWCHLSSWQIWFLIGSCLSLLFAASGLVHFTMCWVRMLYKCTICKSFYLQLEFPLVSKTVAMAYSKCILSVKALSIWVELSDVCLTLIYICADLALISLNGEPPWVLFFWIFFYLIRKGIHANNPHLHIFISLKKKSIF